MRVMIERDWEMFTENIGGVTFGYQSPASQGYGRLVQSYPHAGDGTEV
jgi:hypothetical protein